MPLKKRLAAIEKFRDLIAEQADALARVLTSEVGKPIAQSRNELKGLKYLHVGWPLEDSVRG